VVDAMTAARLLVAAEENATATVRLAHEALISQWRRARDQLVTDARDLHTRALIERQQARWAATSGRPKQQLLLRDPDLANAIDLDRRWGDELDPAAHSFIAVSQHRARFRQRLIAGAAAVFAAVAGIAIWKWSEASTQRDLAAAARQEAIAQRDQAAKARETVVKAYSSLLDTLDELAADGPENLKLLRSIADSSDKTGAALETIGRNYDALVYYSYSPTIYLLLGDRLTAQEQREEALAAYQKSFDVAQKVTQLAREFAGKDVNGTSSPTADGVEDPLPLAELADGHSAIGEALQRQRKLEDALTAYRQSIEAAQKSSESHPRNPLWQSILADDNDNIGGILLLGGKRDQAVAAYRKSLASRIKLADIDKDFTIECDAFRKNASGSWKAIRDSEIHYASPVGAANVVSIASSGASVSTNCSGAGCEATFGAPQGLILRRGMGRSNDLDMATAIDQACAPAPGRGTFVNATDRPMCRSAIAPRSFNPPQPV
jgi:tetratricopeptide (TPR) repeat protein